MGFSWHVYRHYNLLKHYSYKLELHHIFRISVTISFGYVPLYVLCAGEALQPSEHSVGPGLKLRSHFCSLMHLIDDLMKSLYNQFATWGQ